MAQTVKILLAMQEIQVQYLGREDPLEKGMAPHSSILAWRIPWTEKPGGLQSMQLQRVRYFHFHFSQKSGSLIPPAPFFILKTALAVWGLLCLHTNFKTFSSSSVKNDIGNLIGIALNLYIALSSSFDSIDSSNSGKWYISPSVSSLISFISVLSFLHTGLLSP